MRKSRTRRHRGNTKVWVTSWLVTSRVFQAHSANARWSFQGLYFRPGRSALRSTSCPSSSRLARVNEGDAPVLPGASRVNFRTLIRTLIRTDESLETTEYQDCFFVLPKTELFISVFSFRFSVFNQNHARADFTV